MNVYDSILSFHGTWRTYQTRVLKSAQSYLEDKKIHIVAAPGAGKTTLGIELIRRCGLPCLILSPRIVIRQQWLERIQTAFLEDGLSPEDYLSHDICHPKLITSITYQTLFCGMTQYQGVEEEEDTLETEEVDFSSFHLLETVKKAGIQVICLDECHHLKNQWWKALETFLKEMGDVFVISLTATPPYDSTPAQWERYCNMCGPVDEEISVPELVKEGSLCPHQDYVYFNYPSIEEEQQLDAFRKKSRDMLLWLMEDPTLLKIAASHPALWDYNNWFDKMLENPGYLSGLLIYCQAVGISQFLLLDEPTAGLDVLAREDLLNVLRDYMEEDETRSILISSHISTDLEGLCDDLYMIDKGQIILHEDTDTLLGGYGLLKVTKEQYEIIETQYLLRKRKESYGYSLLTNEKQFYLENYPQITVENGSIDEVIAMMVKGEAV